MSLPSVGAWMPSLSVVFCPATISVLAPVAAESNVISMYPAPLATLAYSCANAALSFCAVTEAL